MLSEIEKARIHAALLASGGNRKKAAAALAMDYLKLKDTIYSCPELKERWTKKGAKRVPVEVLGAMAAESIVPPEDVPSEPQLPGELDLQKIAVEYPDISEGLRSLGLPEDQCALGKSYDQFVNRHLAQILSLMTGDAVRTSMRLDSMMEKLRVELEAVTNGVMSIAEVELYKAKLDGFIRIAGIKGGNNDRVHRQIMDRARALVDAQRASEPNRHGKPEFGALKRQEDGPYKTG